MAYPFRKTDNSSIPASRTLQQCLELESNFIKLYQSIKGIVIDPEEPPYECKYFIELCRRLENICNEFKEVGAVLQSAGDSAKKPKDSAPSSIVLICNKKEKDLIVESLYNMSSMLSSFNDWSDEPYKILADQIRTGLDPQGENA